MNTILKASIFVAAAAMMPVSASAITVDIAPRPGIGNGPVNQGTTGPQTGWGASAFASTNGNCPSFCQGASVFDSDGGEGETSASASESTNGEARALVEFNGPTSLPTLKASGTGGVFQRAAGTAFAIQGYTYDGTEALDALFDYTLTGTVQENAGSSNAFISASLAVVAGNSIPYVTDFGTLIFESLGGQSVLGRDSLSINDPSVTSVTSNIAIELNPGDQFFVVAQLTASGRNGTADSFNTLNTQFLNANTGQQITSGLTAAGANPPAVPLPAAAWMLLAGMGGLFGLRRFQRA